MRPIKFRGWYKNEKLMFPIAEITFHKDGDVLAFPLTREAISSYLVGGNVVLIQSTGLLDKNGRDIYEGDIIRMSLDGLRTFVCIYEKGGFQFQDLVHKTVCSNAGSYITHYIEIIGNVHENPELLNQ